ncbi:unnamed protein product [Arctogadus glacialis]
MERVVLQNDMELKATSGDTSSPACLLWIHFPLSEHRSPLASRHLTGGLRLAVCSYEPNFKALTDAPGVFPLIDNTNPPPDHAHKPDPPLTTPPDHAHSCYWDSAEKPSALLWKW